MQKKTRETKDKLLEELVIDVKSVVKVNKGGRQRRYSAIVVVGDRKGKVGLGIGKANEVPDAIKKAIQDANKNLITIPLIDGRTVAHEAIGTAGAARVIIKPAAAGTGMALRKIGTSKLHIGNAALVKNGVTTYKFVVEAN